MYIHTHIRMWCELVALYVFPTLNTRTFVSGLRHTMCPMHFKISPRCGRRASTTCRGSEGREERGRRRGEGRDERERRRGEGREEREMNTDIHTKYCIHTYKYPYICTCTYAHNSQASTNKMYRDTHNSCTCRQTHTHPPARMHGCTHTLAHMHTPLLLGLSKVADTTRVTSFEQKEKQFLAPSQSTYTQGGSKASTEQHPQ